MPALKGGGSWSAPRAELYRERYQALLHEYDTAYESDQSEGMPGARDLIGSNTVGGSP